MNKIRILVIDDEASVTRSIRLNLETLGTYEVRPENHARAAVQTAREFRPDLILLDVMMPEMDGGAVAALLQEDPLLKGTPIVFLTALVSNEETQKREAHIGGMNYLAKPVDLVELTRVIEAHLKGRRETSV
jgi:CheY-like chemotaxis protein